MNFRSNEGLELFLRNFKIIGMGSEGTCYLNEKNNCVYKIFYMEGYGEYNVEHKEAEILRFSNIENKTFIWPDGIIRVNNEFVGYTSKYIKAKNLYAIDPLSVSLDRLCNAIISAKRDIKTVSNNGILTFDINYNELYNGKFYVIDHDRYSIKDEDPNLLEKINNVMFDYEIYLFLIDSYFDNIVKDYKELNSLYENKNEDVLIFIKSFRKYLSELVGKDVKFLREAKKYIDKDQSEYGYQRELKRTDLFY